MPAFRPRAVNVVRQGLHVGEPAVGVDLPCRIARCAPQLGFRSARLDRPAVVDIHIRVAVIDHPRADHGVGRVADDLVGDVVLPDVPAIPAHVRRQREGLAADDPERTAGSPMRIGHLEDHVVGPRVLEPARDLAGRRVHGEPRGQSLCRVAQRSLAAGRNLEQER